MQTLGEEHNEREQGQEVRAYLELPAKVFWPLFLTLFRLHPVIHCKVINSFVVERTGSRRVEADAPRGDVHLARRQSCQSSQPRGRGVFPRACQSRRVGEYATVGRADDLSGG